MRASSPTLMLDTASEYLYLALIDRQGTVLDEIADGPNYLLSNARRAFRACQAKLCWSSSHGLQIDRATAQALEIEAGDTVRYGMLRPQDPSPERNQQTHTTASRGTLHP